MHMIQKLGLKQTSIEVVTRRKKLRWIINFPRAKNSFKDIKGQLQDQVLSFMLHYTVGPVNFTSRQGRTPNPKRARLEFGTVKTEKHQGFWRISFGQMGYN